MGISATVLASKPGQSGTGPTIEFIDLDKTWHGLHFLLSGSAAATPGAEGFMLNGEPVGDASDAEVYLHSAERVVAFSQVLARTAPKDLLGRYDAARMKASDIYPDLAWDQQDFDYLLEYYKVLRDFVQRHASAGHELVVLIC